RDSKYRNHRGEYRRSRHKEVTHHRSRNSFPNQIKLQIIFSVFYSDQCIADGAPPWLSWA
ncbi:MAG: hypothetical protein ACRESE_05310, partial [Gammaproteobacteria bacterium]